MAIKKKDLDREIDRKKFIAKGSTSLKEKEGFIVLSLRLPVSAVIDIDNEKEKRLGLSRNAWILEAIQEKLEKNLS